MYRRERGKVFGLNTLRRRKIQPETALPLDLFTFRNVCTNLMDSNGDKRLTGIARYNYQMFITIIA
ncbi:MAG: hypothetical protein IJY83_08925 [Oscillospiraceae bacterium]|nr:hypothetical protein [Oscillospiraceae bacterium]